MVNWAIQLYTVLWCSANFELAVEIIVCAYSPTVPFPHTYCTVRTLLLPSPLLTTPLLAICFTFLLSMQTAVLKDQFTLPDGTVTSAEPRPNAYIPQSDTELPLPKPYCSQAPFKPSQPVATMRHIRKPCINSPKHQFCSHTVQLWKIHPYN